MPLSSPGSPGRPLTPTSGTLDCGSPLVGEGRGGGKRGGQREEGRRRNGRGGGVGEWETVKEGRATHFVSKLLCAKRG